MNEFLVLLCMPVRLFLYLLNCVYLNPRVYSLLPFRFSPPSQQVGSEQVAAWWLGLNHVRHFLAPNMGLKEFETMTVLFGMC